MKRRMPVEQTELLQAYVYPRHKKALDLIAKNDIDNSEWTRHRPSVSRHVRHAIDQYISTLPKDFKTQIGLNKIK
jgi:hypothetical protein